MKNAKIDNLKIQWDICKWFSNSVHLGKWGFLCIKVGRIEEGWKIRPINKLVKKEGVENEKVLKVDFLVEWGKLLACGRHLWKSPIGVPTNGERCRSTLSQCRWSYPSGAVNHVHQLWKHCIDAKFTSGAKYATCDTGKSPNIWRLATTEKTCQNLLSFQFQSQTQSEYFWNFA